MKSPELGNAIPILLAFAAGAAGLATGVLPSSVSELHMRRDAHDTPQDREYLPAARASLAATYSRQLFYENGVVTLVVDDSSDISVDKQFCRGRQPTSIFIDSQRADIVTYAKSYASDGHSICANGRTDEDERWPLPDLSPGNGLFAVADGNKEHTY